MKASLQLTLAVLGSGLLLVGSSCRQGFGSCTNACMNNLRQLDGAIDQCRIERKLTKSYIVSWEDIRPFLKGGGAGMQCSEGGEYTLDAPAPDQARCSVHGTIAEMFNLPFGGSTPAEVFIPGWKLTPFYTLGNLGANAFGFRPDDSLLVVGEWGPMAKGLYWAREGGTWTMSDAFSVGRAYTDPESVVELPDGIYVVDNQIPGEVLLVGPTGGEPSSWGDDGLINPYDILLVPENFDGPNVDPGDLLVFDNAIGKSHQTAIWAMRRQTGELRLLIQGNELHECFLNGCFAPDGTLYAGLNDGAKDGASILEVTADGNSIVVLENFCPPPRRGSPCLAEVAVHPNTGEVFFSSSGDVYAFIPGRTAPRPVASRSVGLRWAPDGSRLFLISAGTIWTLSGPNITSERVSVVPEATWAAP